MINPNEIQESQEIIPSSQDTVDIEDFIKSMEVEVVVVLTVT